MGRPSGGAYFEESSMFFLELYLCEECVYFSHDLSPSPKPRTEILEAGTFWKALKLLTCLKQKHPTHLRQYFFFLSQSSFEGSRAEKCVYTSYINILEGLDH